MFGAFDDRGRLFVAESSGLDLYAELKAQTRKCRVSRIEDLDGDGRFERASVFADRLVFPMGLVWREGRLYVADPPDLVYFTDRDGDGVADERRVILSGFGHTDNGSLHGLTFGPDGLLYMTMGEPDGYRLLRADGSVLSGRSGALIRCRPDGAKPEVLCRGFENLVEIVFTSGGAIIGTDNWFQKPEAGLRDALVHLVQGGLYPMQPDAGTAYPITGPPLPPAALYPAVALSGLELCRGDAFPPEMRGNLFSAQHNSRKVGRHVLIPEQETFRVEDHDFVAGDDPDFHPSDVLEDADGSLLVIDTGGWYVQHCPTGKIRNSRAAGGIYRVRVKQANSLPDPWGSKLSWESLSPEQLTELLEDRRFPVRERAQRALSARGASAINALAGAVEGAGSVRAKQHSIWALAQISEPSALPPILRQLTGPDPELACVAAHALEFRAERTAAPALCRLLAAPDLQLRLAAAQALAACGDQKALPSIWPALREPAVGRFLEHALIHAAYWIADESALRQALEDAHPRVQKAALLLLDQRPRNPLQPETVLARISSAELELRRAALAVLQKNPAWASQAAEYIRRELKRPNAGEKEVHALQNLILAFQADGAVQDLIGEFLKSPAQAVADERRQFLLETLAQTSVPSPPKAWIDALAQNLRHPVPSARFQAVKTAAVWQIQELDGRLLELATDTREAPELRTEALRGVLARHPKLSASVFELLAAQIAAASNPVSRLAAAGLLSRAELEDAQLASVLPLIRREALISPSLLLPALLRGGPEVFPLALDYLSDAIGQGWRPSDEEMKSLQSKAPRGLQAHLDSLILQLARLREDEGKRLADLEALLAAGQAERGRAVFFGGKAACATCHRVGQEGGTLGPDLTKIGAVRSGRDLLESIVLPSSTFAQGYENYSATSKDGREIDGLIARQTADALVLRDSSGAEHLFRKADISELKRKSTSLMPEGLDSVLSKDEFRDLLAFLQMLK